VVLIHHAIANLDKWDWWVEEVAGGRYVCQKEADRPASTYRHDETVPVKPVGSHPVIAGIGPFTIHDETYKNMYISPKVKVLLKTTNRTSDGPVAWIGPGENSRVVYLQLGHDRAAHNNPAWQKLVRNAIFWSAGRSLPK
jgi:type 1 glutamine amidotransferase